MVTLSCINSYLYVSVIWNNFIYIYFKHLLSILISVWLQKFFLLPINALSLSFFGGICIHWYLFHLFWVFCRSRVWTKRRKKGLIPGENQPKNGVIKNYTCSHSPIMIKQWKQEVVPWLSEKPRVTWGPTLPC